MNADIHQARCRQAKKAGIAIADSIDTHVHPGEWCRSGLFVGNRCVMKLSRRDALLASVAGLLVATSGGAMGAGEGSRSVLQGALDAFFAGWRTGDWRDFLRRCDDSIVFQFPVGAQRGRHHAPMGRAALTAWTAAHAAEGNRITDSVVDLKLFADDWLVICDRGSGTIAGAPYTGLHAIFMRAGKGGKIVEFREYFGELG